MQTFLPYPDFAQSMAVLDYRRLGKQRVEAMQLIRSVEQPSRGWKNHPAGRMWRGHLTALKFYHNWSVIEWMRRGYRNTMALYDIDEPIVYPAWLGDEAFHASHRSNLLRKDHDFYSQYSWQEPADLPYVWPQGAST